MIKISSLVTRSITIPIPIPHSRLLTTVSTRSLSSCTRTRTRLNSLALFPRFLSSSVESASHSASSSSSPAVPALLDTHHRFHNYLRVSLTERCNLRCRYCMPADGVELTPEENLLSTNELNRLVKLFIDQGINKIRFTGGEPLIRSDIEEIIKQTNQFRRPASTTATAGVGLDSISITTNGLVLHRKLSRLIDSGLNNVNISLDTLVASKFETISRRPGFALVWKSIQEALAALRDNKLNSLKLNCVVMKGVNDSEIISFVELLRDWPIEIRFIEYMPFGGNQWKSDKFMSSAEIRQLIESHFNEKLRLYRNENEKNETSRKYELTGFKGKIGIISSMSDHFCSSCNRLRLTADGNLKVCLFGNTEVSLRDAIRNPNLKETDLVQLISMAVKQKSQQFLECNHSRNRHQKQNHKRNVNNQCIHSNIYNNVNNNNISRAYQSINSNSNYSLAAATLFPHRLNSSSASSSIRCFSSPNRSSFSSSSASGLSHLNSSNLPSMVDISHKSTTARTAIAHSFMWFPQTFDSIIPINSQNANAINQNESKSVSNPSNNTSSLSEFHSPKGPVFATAIIAGTLAVKSTSSLIPFCHPLIIESIKFDIQRCNPTDVTDSAINYHSPADEGIWIRIECLVRISGKTGVEMESLTGASIAALTIYDMCKALSHEIRIVNTKLIRKEGGKSGIISNE